MCTNIAENKTEIDITLRVYDIFSCTNLFGVTNDMDKIHWVSNGICMNTKRLVVDTNSSSGILPFIDVEEICRLVEKDNMHRKNQGIPEITIGNGKELCLYINRKAAKFGNALDEYERTRITPGAHYDGELDKAYNKLVCYMENEIKTFISECGNSVHILGAGNASVDNPELVDAIKSVGDSLNDGLGNKIDGLGNSLGDKIDGLNDGLGNKMDSLGTSICNKIDSSKDRFEAAKQEALNKELQAHNIAVAEINKDAVNSKFNWGSEMVDAVEGMIRKGKHIWLYGPSRSGKSKAVSIALGRLDTEFIYLNLNEYLNAREFVSRAFTYGGDVGYKDTILKVKLDELESGHLDRLAVIIEDPNSIKFNELMNSFKSFLGGSDTLTIGDHIYKNLKGKLIFIVTSNDRGNGKFVMDQAFEHRFIQIKSYKYLDRVYEYRKENGISRFECTPQCKELLVNLIHDTEEIIQQLNKHIENYDIVMNVDLMSKLMITTCLEESIRNGDTFNDFKSSIETTVWYAVGNSISVLRRNGISRELENLSNDLNDLEKKWNNQWILRMCQ